MVLKLNNPRIYLASRNPRRRELLTQMATPFDAVVFRSHPREDSEIDESRQPGASPRGHVERLARAKAEHAWRVIIERRLLPQPVLAANTAVEIDGMIVGKPIDNDDAKRMLRLLSGKTHRVLTAVALAFGRRVETTLSVNEVRFATIDEAQISDYVASGEPIDKNGAYSIQGRAGQFVEHLDGSYSGVMGLPLFETAAMLRRFGYPR